MAEVMRWEWENQPPSQDQVLEALGSLRSVWGVKTIDYAAHVLPMGQGVTRYFDQDDNPVPLKKMGRKEKLVPVWKLYMQVAGRELMLNEAQETNDWEVSFVPDKAALRDESGHSGDMPAFVLKNSVIYRESIEIWQRVDEGRRFLGRRSGMAALKTGGMVPPWEKMETAARGRALGAWGFGVLPGSGIASLDEMELAANYDYQPNADEVEQLEDRPREEIEEEVRTAMEKLRVVRDRAPEEMSKIIQVYAYEISGIQPAIDESGVIDLAGLGKPHLELLRRKIDRNLREVRSASE